MEGQGGGFWRKQEISRGTWRRRVDGDTPTLAGAAASAALGQGRRPRWGTRCHCLRGLGAASCSAAGARTAAQVGGLGAAAGRGTRGYSGGRAAAPTPGDGGGLARSCPPFLVSERVEEGGRRGSGGARGRMEARRRGPPTRGHRGGREGGGAPEEAATGEAGGGGASRRSRPEEAVTWGGGRRRSRSGPLIRRSHATSGPGEGPAREGGADGRRRSGAPGPGKETMLTEPRGAAPSLEIWRMEPTRIL